MASRPDRSDEERLAFDGLDSSRVDDHKDEDDGVFTDRTLAFTMRRHGYDIRSPRNEKRCSKQSEC